MSTRSLIGYFDSESPEIKMVYCHWDGYPEHNGKLLLNHYNYRQVQELIELCINGGAYISALDTTIKCSELRETPDYMVYTFSNLDEMYDFLNESWCEFAYIKMPDETVFYIDQLCNPRKVQNLDEYFKTNSLVNA